MTALRTTSGVTKSKWDHRQSSTCLLLMSPWVQTKRPLQQSSPPGKKGLHPCVKASSHGAHVRVLWLPSGSISTLDAQLSCFQEHITNSKERPILQAKKKKTENRTKSHKQLLSSREGGQGCQRCVVFIKCDLWVCSNADHRATRNTVFQAIRGGETKHSNRITFLDKKEGGLFRRGQANAILNDPWLSPALWTFWGGSTFSLGLPSAIPARPQTGQNITVLTSPHWPDRDRSA